MAKSYARIKGDTCKGGSESLEEMSYGKFGNPLGRVLSVSLTYISEIKMWILFKPKKLLVQSGSFSFFSWGTNCGHSD